MRVGTNAASSLRHDMTDPVHDAISGFDVGNDILTGLGIYSVSAIPMANLKLLRELQHQLDLANPPSRLRSWSPVSMILGSPGTQRIPMHQVRKF